MISFCGRKPNVSVLGSYTATEEEAALAYEIGKLLANLQLNVISGGQKGVMHQLCKGVSENRAGGMGRACTIVGILPTEDFSSGNEFLDIAIPTGSGALQNNIVPLCADAVVAIGGSAGTLTEIAYAWQFKKPIALIGSTGWASKLAGQKIDERRSEPMPHFADPIEIINWLRKTLNI